MSLPSKETSRCFITVIRKKCPASIFPKFYKFILSRKPEFRPEIGNAGYAITTPYINICTPFDDKFKFVYNGFDFDELYDLEKDPYQLENIVDMAGPVSWTIF